MSQVVPIPTLHLFHKLDDLLLDLLKSLSADDWDSATISPQWTVKDIAAHLLDGNIRSLSILRDGYRGDPPGQISSYQDLVTYLNDLNTIWVLAFKRISPRMLVESLQRTGKEYVDYLHTLKPFDPAVFSVAWAGESESQNWFHIAREYTEKWHHQQQIREAFGLTAPLMTPEFFKPCIETFLRALPHAYRDTEAEIGTLVKVQVTGEAGGTWFIEKTIGSWRFVKNMAMAQPAAAIQLRPDVAWKLFTKGLKAADATEGIEQEGNEKLLKPVLAMIAVMG
jgi:hypothetical protein